MESLKFLGRLEIAKIASEKQSEILTEWEARSRSRLSAAKAQSRLALRDSLPLFLNNLVDALTSDNPKSQVEKSTEIAREHAEDRANQPEYTLDQVISEFHILRAVIIEFIEARGPTDVEGRKIIHDFIDLGISKSAVRYIELESKRQGFQTAEIEATKVEAERASQAKSAFLANMSHEIRTPLGAIMGFVGLIKDAGSGLDAEVSHYLSIVERNSHHLLRIIDDILDLTKVESGHMAVENVEFQFIEFLADFASLAGMKAREKAIAFEFKSETPLPERIISDPTRIRQILTNVVGNAIKFTDSGSVELKLLYGERHIEFRVTDTGRGISQDQRTSLFQAFSQADSSNTRRFGGTGLGLILTKKLSEMLGGDFILVESEMGSGSVFHVSIPVRVPEDVKFVALKNLKIAAGSEVETKTVEKDFEILVVEDSPDNQFLIRKMLEKNGFKVTVAGNGAEGLEIASKKNFDVILMDIQMPLMDGHQVVRALRAQGYTGQVVALTAHAMKEEAERATKSGFSHFLTKPINRKTLLDLLERIRTPLNLRL